MLKFKKQISLDDEEEFANFYNREHLLQFLQTCMDQHTMDLLASWKVEQEKAFKIKSSKKQLVFNNRNNDLLQPIQT